MFLLFKLNRPIGVDTTMDEDDVLLTKRALGALGHIKVPKGGITPYPDMGMIKGLKAFQRQNGLRPDGVMNPDGPTISKLSRIIAERQQRKQPPNPLSKVPLPPPRNLLDTLWTAPRKRQSRPAMSSVFRLSGDMGRNHRNHPRDFLALQGALASAGHFRPRRSLAGAGANDELFDAVKRFQQAAGLKTDGLVGRGGETERTLNKFLTSMLAAAGKSLPAQAASNQAKISERDKDLCDERFRRELQRCARWPGKWHGPCAQRATIRWGLCYRYGYTPGPDREPPEWGPGDMEESFNPKR